MATALTLPPIVKDEIICDTLSARIFEFMYGSPERTWITMTLAFTLLALGISMMQTSGTGGACMIH